MHWYHYGLLLQQESNGFTGHLLYFISRQKDYWSVHLKQKLIFLCPLSIPLKERIIDKVNCQLITSDLFEVSFKVISNWSTY